MKATESPNTNVSVELMGMPCFKSGRLRHGLGSHVGRVCAVASSDSSTGKGRMCKWVQPLVNKHEVLLITPKCNM